MCVSATPNSAAAVSAAIAKEASERVTAACFVAHDDIGLDGAGG